tara:strand:- start:305 stop:637 length:333 start_codon:yes stop_codon:yes gene_type:complete
MGEEGGRLDNRLIICSNIGTINEGDYMSRKHGMGWDNGNIVPIGNSLKSYSGRHIVNSEKATIGKNIIINHAYHNKLQMQMYLQEKREQKDDALWAENERMLEELNDNSG